MAWTKYLDAHFEIWNSSSSLSSSSSSFSSSSSSSYSFSSSSSCSSAPLVWPSLSKGFDLEIGELLDDTGQDVSELDAGSLGVAGRYLRPVHRLRIRYSLLPDADRWSLDHWIADEIHGPVRAFEVTDPTTGWVWRCRLDPKGSRKWSSSADHPDRWNFSADLIEDTEEGYFTEVYG